MSPVAIRLVRVSARFQHRVKGAIAAVHDVNLDVQPGELLTLLGPSGCGKTTTLRMIAGFQEPSEGRIFIGDQDVTDLMSNRRNIGFVFQNYALFPHLTVFENVAYGLRVQKQPGAAIADAVTGVLGLVGLGGYEKQMPHQLSGGEQQRVALARAIVIKPRVLLFDEPLSNLDARLRVQMRGEIQQLQKSLGITTVYVTHDQEEAMAISDRIAVMNKGEIAQLGSAEELYRRPASAFVARFIGRTNLLRARIAGLAADHVDLDVANSSWRVHKPANGHERGAQVLAVLRPETIAIDSADSADGIAATVVSRTYLGEKVEYAVAVGEDLVQIVRFNPPPTERFGPGTRVTIRLPTTDVQFLAGDES